MGSLSEYGPTAGAVHNIDWRIVWCPKDRSRVLVGEVADRLKALLGAKAADLGWTVEALEVMPDHVHLFVRPGPDASAGLVAHQLKGFSSRVLRSGATIGWYIAEETTRPIKGAA